MKINLFAYFIFLILFSHLSLAQKQNTNPSLEKTVNNKKIENVIFKTDETLDRFFFTPKENGVQVSPIVILYDINDLLIKVGGTTIGANSFRIEITKQSEDSISVAWPAELLAQGKIEIINKQGKSLFNKTFDLTKEETTELKFLITNISKILPELVSKQDDFRICLSRQIKKESTQLCSPYYAFSSKNPLKISLLKYEFQNRRFINNEESSILTGEFTPPIDKMVTFLAENKAGYSYFFAGLPSPSEVIEIIEDTGKMKLSGFGPKPIGYYTALFRRAQKSFLYDYKPSPAFFERDDFWSITTPINKQFILNFNGQQVGVFSQKIQFEQLPQEKNRPLLAQIAEVASYKQNSTHRLLKADKTLIAKKQDSDAIVDDGNYTYFQSENSEIFKLNRSYLDLQDAQGKKWTVMTENYRGTSSEFSIRTTGLLTAQSVTYLGEVKIDKWFEDIFGWQNAYLSKLRWGISAKAYQNLTDFQSEYETNAGTVTQSSDIQLTNVDLKYRFNPGLWNRDESIGAILSYQDILLGVNKASMYGYGAFWARSMPLFFDTLFNYLPFMNYSKYVDMELIYYPKLINTTTMTTKGNWALNFHGKVAWSQRIFGEAGFGTKVFSFYNSSTDRTVEFASFYITFGLGLNF